MGIKDHDKENFKTLTRAFENNDVCLVDVQRKSDGKQVAAICAVSFVDGEYHITPLAIMIDGNPFEDFEPPNPDGGYYNTEGD